MIFWTFGRQVVSHDKKGSEPTSQEVEGILNDSGPVFASSVKWASRWVSLEQELLQKEDLRFNEMKTHTRGRDPGF